MECKEIVELPQRGAPHLRRGLEEDVLHEERPEAALRGVCVGAQQQIRHCGANVAAPLNGLNEAGRLHVNSINIQYNI